MVFTRFLGCIDLQLDTHTSLSTHSLTDGQTQMQYASGTVFQWRQQKTRDTGLPSGKDRIPLHSLFLTQYRSVTD